jgi:hypothetical protein
MMESLFERRQDADCAGAPFAYEETGAVIAEAERFLASVEERIAGRAA